ncbi:uncharacterized protein LOC110756842 isoform X2 [Prunus avium]|uniref:Uncharacterized protein LOC110756842 isoform X2 n=1 Tax=Prunus avium TaxID=42229 RepID=A0A6P5SIB2_PRUAV|nr:uncharacterized protein LOC110756842 isoform X2 [Prunus avium]
MEFNFRSLDKRSPPPLPSTLGYFSQHPHALRATQQTQTAPMIERQLEKEKIREEIMAAERRRLLEAEVRRELMLERDIAMRRAAAADGLAFDHHPRLLHHPLDHDRFATSLINNHNLIPLAKPDPNLSGVKRKTPPTAGASELPPTGLKKKPKEIWSCAMCQVSARSQKVFNQHLNGKKHKANEARLRAQKLGKSSSSAPLSKQTAKFSEPEEIRESLDPSDGLDEKMQDACTSKEKKEELPMENDQCRENLKIKDEVEVVQGPGRKEAVRKKKFKFWCERCKVGAYSPNVMLAHMTGKKHIAKRQEVTPSNVPIASSLASSVEASKEAEDAGAAKEAHEKIPTETAIASSGTNANGKAENADLTKEANNTALIVFADSDRLSAHSMVNN